MQRIILTLAVLSLACTGPGTLRAAPAADAGGGPLSLDDLRTLTDVFSLTRDHYVEPVDERALFQSAISGMVSSLDAYSKLLGPDALQAQEDSSRGRYGGVGIEIRIRDARLYVSEVIGGTPAFAAGVKAGDLILAVDGQAIRGRLLSEAIDSLRGEPGTEVELMLQSPGMPSRSVTLTREFINVSSVVSRRLEGRFGYFRVSHFHVRSADDMRDAIRAMTSEGPGSVEGIVLDLRGNPGGVVKAALTMADGFLDRGLVVYTRGRYAATQIEYSAQPGQWAEGVPVVILVNRVTASAAEILAGALQDHGRATVVGEATYGKGTVQSLFRLRNGSALKITTARYFTPSGRSIEAQGIVPDVPIGEKIFAVTQDGDETSPGFEPGTPVEEAIAAVSPEADFALAAALDILRGESPDSVNESP